MRCKIICSNIVNVPADALIYSTNVGLALTGGVGAALRSKFGLGVQMDLIEAFKKSKKIQASVGDVFMTRLPYTSWKVVFHTIATSEDCYTAPETVSGILQACLSRCVKEADVSSVVCSPLGSGFGDLPVNIFCEIVESTLSDYAGTSIEAFSIVCNDQLQYEGLCRHLSDSKSNPWEQLVLEKARRFRR